MDGGRKMESISCKNCNATGLRLVNGYWVCEYCGSRFLPTKEERNASARGTAYAFGSQRSGSSEVALSDDVERLLEKCRKDRKNARKYANLILDMDPDNEEALKYL